MNNNRQQQIDMIQRLPISREQQIDLLRRIIDGSIKTGVALTSDQDGLMQATTQSPKTTSAANSSFPTMPPATSA